MLTIPCPTCGPRPVEEFRFGGEPPDAPDWVTDADERDLHRVWFYANTAGEEVERWFHLAGCHRWCTVRRDTLIDRVTGTVTGGDVPVTGPTHPTAPTAGDRGGPGPTP